MTKIEPDKYLIVEHKQRHWNIADVYKNGTKITTVNKFYEVSDEWIIIYETVGGSGYGYSKGDVLQKIFIGDSGLNKEYTNESP